MPLNEEKGGGIKRPSPRRLNFYQDLKEKEQMKRDSVNVLGFLKYFLRL